MLILFDWKQCLTSGRWTFPVLQNIVLKFSDLPSDSWKSLLPPISCTLETHFKEKLGFFLVKQRIRYNFLSAIWSYYVFLQFANSQCIYPNCNLCTCLTELPFIMFFFLNINTTIYLWYTDLHYLVPVT